MLQGVTGNTMAPNEFGMVQDLLVEGVGDVESSIPQKDDLWHHVQWT
jgi:hypothetical protein